MFVCIVEDSDVVVFNHGKDVDLLEGTWDWPFKKEKLCNSRYSLLSTKVISLEKNRLDPRLMFVVWFLRRNSRGWKIVIGISTILSLDK